MKFREERPFADVDAAVKKLLEIANGMAADHAGRLSVGILNTQSQKSREAERKLLPHITGCA